MTHPRCLQPAAVALASMLLLTGGAALGQTAQALQMRSLAATCATCHGTEGKAVEGAGMAQLAGLPKDYIVAQMQAFQNGTRPATVMHQLTKGYSNEQIDALAAYFANKK